jgi:hypothetical protein
MAFTKRRYYDYRPLPHDSIYNKDFVNDDEATQIVNNVLNLYSHARRNVGSNIGWGDFASGYLAIAVNKGQYKQLAVKPMNQIMSGGNTIRVWVYCSRQLATADMEIKVNIGPFEETTALSTGAGVYGWVLVTIVPPRVNNTDLTNDHVLKVRVGMNSTSVAASDTIRVKGIGIFQWPPHTTDKIDWIDTTVANVKFGDADYPHSAGLVRGLARKLFKVRAHRSLRSNILQKWFDESLQAIGAAYSATYDTFGRYIVRKASGITGLRAVLCIPTSAVVQGLVRLGIWSIDAIEYDNIATAFTAGAVVTDQTTGAIARILAIQLGPPNYLLLSPFEYTIGTFQNNSQITDDEGGDALVNGTNLGSMEVTSTTAAWNMVGITDYFHNLAIAGLIDDDAEYEIRLDARDTVGAGGNVELSLRFLVETPGTAVTKVLPNPVRTEQDDDIFAETIEKCRDTLDDIWARQTQILINDIPIYSADASDRLTVKSKSYLNYPYEGVGYGFTSTENRVFAGGYVYPSPGATKLKARVVFGRTDTRDIRIVNVDGGALPQPAVGETITTVPGSNNTAEIVDTNLTAGAPYSGTLTLKNVMGNFRDNETLTFSGAGTAVVNGEMFDMLDKKLYLRFSTWHPELEEEFYDEKDLADIPVNQIVILEFEIKIHTQYENSDVDYTHSIPGNWEAPYCWVLQGKTDNLADYIYLHELQVWEVPDTPASAVMTLMDD